jgi:cell envelope-related function transcriptional attenuator common domain
MAQRANRNNSREEYRRIQERKKRKIAKQKGYTDIESNSYSAMEQRYYAKKKLRDEKQRRKKERRQRKGSTIRGMFLLTIQVMALLVFMIALFSLDALPTNYLLIIGCILIMTAGITLGTQLSSKRKRIGGKLFSLIMSFIMIGSTYYIIKADNLLNMVTGATEYQLDHMVVAVLNEDMAENITDAASYTFAVQYAKDRQNMENAVSTIGNELSAPITTKELSSMPEQAQALMSGEVQAIVYNQGYTEILNHSVEGFSEQIRVIFEYDIKTELQDLTIDMEVNEEPFAIYISGIDVHGEISTNSRSDVNIIAIVNPKSHQILLVTTPRDYYVPIPGISGGAKDKLTHAGLYGVEASMDTLEALYDIEIAFYARINFTSMIEIVDILGGIEVESESAFTIGKDAGGPMEIQEGVNYLNGEQALGFSRERQAFIDGDNRRGRNQQKVITGMIRKMLSPTMIVKAGSILDAVGDKVDTNMSPDQIRSLIKQQMQGNTSWQIASMAAEGEGIKGICYSSGAEELYVTMPYDRSTQEIKGAIDRVFAGELLEDSVIVGE